MNDLESAPQSRRLRTMGCPALLAILAVALLLSTCNLADPGPPDSGQPDPEPHPVSHWGFAEHVAVYDLLRELGHALIEEHDVKVLLNRENMADSFAAVYVTRRMYRFTVESHRWASATIIARAASWIEQDGRKSPYNHNGRQEERDIRRAYRAMCRLYGSDPKWFDNGADRYRPIGKRVEFSTRDLNDCGESETNEMESWAPIWDGAADGGGSSNVTLVYHEVPLTAAWKKTGVMERIAEQARLFRWPHGLALRFGDCAGEVSWNADTRTITLCAAYVTWLQQRASTIQWQ